MNWFCVCCVIHLILFLSRWIIGRSGFGSQLDVFCDYFGGKAASFGGEMVETVQLLSIYTFRKQLSNKARTPTYNLRCYA